MRISVQPSQGWLVSAGEWAKNVQPLYTGTNRSYGRRNHNAGGERQQSKDVAGIIIGFGILFIGMNTMSDAVYPLRESEVFKISLYFYGL